MKRIGISLFFCAMLFSVSGLAQDVYVPSLLKESTRKNVEQLKSGIVGSYPRHTEEFKWETDWVLFRTIETSYTSFGEPAVIEFNQNGNKTMDLFSYDDQHRQTEVLSKVMVSNAWVNESRQTVSYSNQGLMAEMRHEEWNGTGWNLVTGSQIAYELDGDRVKVMTFKSWNTVTSAWENTMRETYTYPATGVQYTTSVIEMWDNAWVLTMKNEYTWTDNRIAEWLSYIYESDAWTLSTKTTYEYQSYHSTIMTTYSSIGPDEWMGTQRLTITYDSHGNVTLNQMEMNMGAWTIFSATRFQLTYSGNDLTQRISQSYSLFPPAVQGASVTPVWKNVLKEVYSNFASLSTDITFLPDAGLSVFPNPSGKQAIVRMSLLKAGSVTLSVYSMTGQKIIEEVLTVNGSDVNYQLNLSGVRPGSYVLIARDKQGVEIGKTRLIKDKE